MPSYKVNKTTLNIKNVFIIKQLLFIEKHAHKQFQRSQEDCRQQKEKAKKNT